MILCSTSWWLWTWNYGSAKSSLAHLRSIRRLYPFWKQSHQHWQLCQCPTRWSSIKSHDIWETSRSDRYSPITTTTTSPAFISLPTPHYPVKRLLRNHTTRPLHDNPNLHLQCLFPNVRAAKTRACLSILRPFDPAELRSPTLRKELVAELEIFGMAKTKGWANETTIILKIA